MEKYRVVIYPVAQNDLLEIVDYLNTLSPDAAIKYYDLLIEQIGSLAEMPERCPLVKDAQLRLRGYRTLLVKNYIVFYVVNGKCVEIRRILYNRRQYDALL
jgi:toxin ParE1/3/4